MKASRAAVPHYAGYAWRMLEVFLSRDIVEASECFLNAEHR